MLRLLAQRGFVSFLSLLFVFSFVIALPNNASAQTSELGLDSLSIDVQPKTPSPGNITTITLYSAGANLGRSNITWSLNGSSVAAATGKTSFSFTMGALGTRTTVSVRIESPGRAPMERTLSFSPGAVTLLVEGKTYTPPFYRGSPRYAPGAELTVVALPTILDEVGNKIPDSELSFEWKINGEPRADRSGTGKNILSYVGSQLLEAEEIEVDILRRNGLRVAYEKVIVPSSSPILRVYKQDPLRGILYTRSLSGNISIADRELSLVAEPYFVSGDAHASGLTYTWTINDSVVATPDDPQMLTVRQDGSGTVAAGIQVSVQHTGLRKLLQQAQTGFALILGAGGAQTIFGI